ncbi:hypothetical protein [Helicobacter sp.]|uniref:hypothetical protein n=1 Tax=Helicobacter sp. TaxID=218 RepID=UPI0019BEBF9A|nr:hypothetical protein [Helicobacter sp.]MBD5164365.1 hypothetical protein [Helicobacter sp.]
MNDENLSLNENQSEDSTQGENDESQGTSDTGSKKGDQETEQGTENQESESEDNPQESNNQNKIAEQIATLKKALEYLESQNEQGFNQEIEIAKLQEILQQIEQLRRAIFVKQEQRLEESEAYFALVGVKVALLEKLKVQNEC